jgi:hypothetical protein
MATTPAGRMLARQLQQMQQDKDIPGISCGLVDNNVFEWEVMLMISDDVKLYGGMYTFSPQLPNGSPGRTVSSSEGILTLFGRWFLPCSIVFPSRVSAHAAENEV